MSGYDKDFRLDRKKKPFQKFNNIHDKNKSSALTAAGIDVKWSQDAWLRCEVKLNDFDLLVLKNLVVTAKDQEDEDSIYKVMGEYLYTSLRPHLNTNYIKLLESTDSRVSTPSSLNNKGKQKGGRKGKVGNKATKGPSKAEQIRAQNSLGTLCTKLETSLKGFVNYGDEFKRPNFLKESEKIVEMRGIGFMCCAWFLLSKRKKLEWDNELKTLTYTVIVSLQRFIGAASGLTGKSHLDSLKEDTVSTTMISDLENILVELKDKFGFDGEKIYMEAPQLLVFSNLDDMLPISSIKPYAHQSRICDILKNNMQTGFYVMYRAVTNAGKTTTIVSLAATIQKLRKTNPKFEKLQIIFSCGSTPVKEQALQWLYNSSNINAIAQLPFAIAFFCPNRGLVIRNSWSCQQNPDDRLVIVCSPSVAVTVIKERRNPYILFHDEPTIGAENPTSEQCINNVMLMANSPKWTIISSATLPSQQELEPFTNIHKAKYPNALHENIYSDSIKIGCDVYSHNGATYIPHKDIHTQKNLQKCVTNIKNNLFLSRTYTPLTVAELSRHCEDQLDIPKIGQYFSNIKNLSANAVRLYGLEILSLLSKESDETVNSICKGEIRGNARDLNFKKLGTTEAYKFPQMSLIACENPVTFALNIFSDLLEDINNSKNTIDKLVAQFWKKQNQWTDELERLRKQRKKPPTKRRGDDDDGDNEEVDYAQQEMDLLANKPFISFPEVFQINTKRHIEKYATSTQNIPARYPLPSFDFITDSKMNVSNEVKMLLCCGVGIYAPENVQLKNDEYLSTIKSLAQKGQLAYLVADHNISYGVNFPFSRSIISEDFTNAHSMNTVFQLMSRAGRVGQSWFAEAFVSDKVLITLQKYAQENISPDNQLEINNMVSALHVIRARAREERERLLQSRSQ